jgi:hypothetical protein
MWSLINTVCRRRESLLALSLSLLAMCAAALAQDVTLQAPSSPVAGEPTSIATTGSGSGSFYLEGPAIALKRDVQLGQAIPLGAKDVPAAGRYVATFCTSSCSSTTFYVSAAKPSTLTFLVHPSRAPVGENGVISGVAFPFDEFGNLVLAPATVDFQMTAKGSAPNSHSAQTHDGVAWFRASSGKTAGALQVSASLHDVTARRVVQEVASDPCSLRIKGERTPKGIMVETEPVRDCSGNPVPDGTIITFTAKSGDETSTVDAPVKQDVARARITSDGPVVISAASGVVMGNELHLGR